MSTHQTFPALEELKQEADGVDVLVELSPIWLESFADWLFDFQYVSQKRALLKQRDQERKQYQSGRKRIESTYGTAVIRVLERRADREQPRFEIDRMSTELTDAKTAIDSLHADLDEDFLTQPERRKLVELESDIVKAREYLRNKRAFDEQKPNIAPKIKAFEDRFALYSEKEQYMVTADRQYLIEQSQDVWAQLSDLARELQLHVIPDQDAAWLSEQKTRFGELIDRVPDYNEMFVTNERKRYAHLLEEQPKHPLNEQQQKAVIRDDRRNLIDASAGTGKTLTLTYRFIYLLEKGVRADNIAAITYTKDAANEMKERIADIADIDENDLNIHTIHSLALRIVGDATVGTSDESLGETRKALVNSYLNTAFGNLDVDEADLMYPDVYQDFAVALEEFSRIDAQENYVEEHKHWNQSRESYLYEKLEEFVEKARTFNLSPDDIREKIDGSNPIRFYFATAGSALLEAYLRRVNESDHPLDYDEMIYAATELVNTYPDEFGSQYRHVLVDEFQDVSEATLSFIEAFMGGNNETHLFCVGDDWQSIYGFNGSNVRYFTEYEERFDEVTYTSLEINYRCPPSIVQAGVDLMAQSQAPQNEKAVRAFSDLNTNPTLHRLSGLYRPRVPGYVADLVEEALRGDRDYDDVMILSRNDANSSYLKDLREELAAREIPHERPKYTNDFLPERYCERFDRKIEFDEEGNAQFESRPDNIEPDIPPIVAVRSIHASKGTEAPVVILAHAVDDDPEGIPIEKRTDDLLEPAVEITADHIPEERRLFYVSLTRCEEEFHAIAKDGQVSRYIDDIHQHFDVIEPDDTIIGRCTTISQPPSNSKKPLKAVLDCGTFEAPLMAWPNNNPPRLQKGSIYRIFDPVVVNNGYGEEVRYDQSSIELETDPEQINDID